VEYHRVSLHRAQYRCRKFTISNLETPRIPFTCSVEAAVLQYSQYVPAEVAYLHELLLCNTQHPLACSLEGSCKRIE
jgi:hypothetical protein